MPTKKEDKKGEALEAKLNAALAKAFPNGIPKPETIENRVRKLFKFLEEIGFRLIKAHVKERTADFTMFIGDPIRRRGIELRWTCHIDVLKESTPEESLEGLVAYVMGAYHGAVMDAYSKRK